MSLLAAKLDVQQPKPGSQLSPQRLISEVAKLERTAERLSLGTEIGEEIRKIWREEMRKDVGTNAFDGTQPATAQAPKTDLSTVPGGEMLSKKSAAPTSTPKTTSMRTPSLISSVSSDPLSNTASTSAKSLTSKSSSISKASEDPTTPFITTSKTQDLSGKRHASELSLETSPSTCSRGGTPSPSRHGSAMTNIQPIGRTPIRPDQVLRYKSPPTAEMVYYPAPVPKNLRLPKRLSRRPQAASSSSIPIQHDDCDAGFSKMLHMSLKNGSAVATLNALLDASVNAPVAHTEESTRVRDTVTPADGAEGTKRGNSPKLVASPNELKIERTSPPPQLSLPKSRTQATSGAQTHLSTIEFERLHNDGSPGNDGRKSAVPFDRPSRFVEDISVHDENNSPNTARSVSPTSQKSSITTDKRPSPLPTDSEVTDLSKRDNACQPLKSPAVAVSTTPNRSGAQQPTHPSSPLSSHRPVKPLPIPLSSDSPTPRPSPLIASQSSPSLRYLLPSLTVRPLALRSPTLPVLSPTTMSVYNDSSPNETLAQRRLHDKPPLGSKSIPKPLPALPALNVQQPPLTASYNYRNASGSPSPSPSASYTYVPYSPTMQSTNSMAPQANSLAPSQSRPAKSPVASARPIHPGGRFYSRDHISQGGLRGSTLPLLEQRSGV